MTECSLADMTHSDVQALSTSMLTSNSTLMKYYVKVNPQTQYRQAQEKLNGVLGKRSRTEDSEPADA